MMFCPPFSEIANGYPGQINPVHQPIVEIIRETRFDDLEIRRDVEVTGGQSEVSRTCAISRCTTGEGTIYSYQTATPNGRRQWKPVLAIKS
jgi:hypothetical protein